MIFYKAFIIYTFLNYLIILNYEMINPVIIALVHLGRKEWSETE